MSEISKYNYFGKLILNIDYIIMKNIGNIYNRR